MCGYFCIGFIGFMLAGKTLTDFINLFSSNNFLKNNDIILSYFMTKCLKMVEHDPHETPNMYPNLRATPLNAVLPNNEQQFRLKKINQIKDCFVAEIKERELTSKTLCKYTASLAILISH